jgi:glycosyltransferase involved in cell wall biosynthesis
VKARIALVVPAFELGGGVPNVALFLKRIAERTGMFEVKVVSLATSARDPFSLRITRPRSWRRGAVAHEADWNGASFTHVGALASELEFQRFLPRRVLANTLADCDILQVVCGSPAWGNAVCGLGKPVSIQCATRVKLERRRRDSTAHGYSSWWRKNMTTVTDILERRALRTADAIQVENSLMYEYSLKINSLRQVDLRYAPPGVDTSTFCPGAGNACDPYVLCVARLDDPRKNIELLLKAFALVPESRDKLRLVVAGQDAPDKTFWMLASKLELAKRITFVSNPTVDALVNLYRGACVFVLPSDEEGFGMVVIEAMACGTPVVATRSGGPDGIITDGWDGYLVAVGAETELASRIAFLSRNEMLRREIGKRARATVVQRYSETVAGKPFINVWRNLVERDYVRCNPLRQDAQST